MAGWPRDLDMGNEHGKLQRVPTPAGIQCMDETLQKKFSKGIQYNSKFYKLIYFYF